MVSFSGLGSGVDFGAITDQLVKLEKLPISKIEGQKTGANRQITLVGDFAMKVRGLETAAKALSTPAQVRAVKASSSDENRVKVTANGQAQLGNFDISVTALARSQTNQSRTFATDARGVMGSGSLDLTVGDGETITIDYDDDDSLSILARRINDANAGVRASVLNDGTSFRMLLSSDESGAAHAVTFGDSGGVFGFDAPGNELVAARDAQFTVAGVPVTRPSNTLTDVIEGVTFELKTETPPGEPATRVAVSRDPDGLAEKVKAFVDALNNVQSFVSGQLSNKTADPNESLRNDSMLQGFQRRIGGLLSSAHGPDDTSLGMFGIKLDRDGSMSLDRAKLDKAIAANPDGLTRMLAGVGDRSATPVSPADDPDGSLRKLNGLVASLTSLTGEYTRSGDGILATKQTAIRSRIKGWDGQIERIELKASSLEERLRKQFTATDQTIALLNSQTTFISSILF